MKPIRLLLAATILAAFSMALSINTYARVKPSQTQPDSIADRVKSKEVSIDRKGRYITLDIHYDIENSNIFLVFRNMNVDGTTESNITI